MMYTTCVCMLQLTNPDKHKPPFRFATVPSGATEENIKMNFKHMFKYMRNYNKSTVGEGIKALNNGYVYNICDTLSKHAFSENQFQDNENKNNS